MDDISMENAILAQLRFGIGDIAKQMELIEQMAKQAAINSQNAFKNANLLSPVNTQAMTAQQAMVGRITAEGEANKARIVAEGEAKISAIQAKEALTREKIAQNEARTQLAILQRQMAEEKILYMRSREQAFAARGSMTDLLQRRTSWLISGGLVMGGLGGAYETISTIKDVEMGMTTIARITEDVTFNFKGMRDEIMQLGVEYGQTFDVTSDIATRWAQAGYNVADTLELTKDALLALNTAELNSDQATQGLIAIMSQWEIEAENLLPIIDKINITADNYAVTSQDLVDGLNKTGAAARNAGLTIEETIGAITVLRESSGAAGKEVGNALKTILAYMTRNKTINLMESLGIQVFEDEARTTFRSVMELMDELSAKWQDPSVSMAAMTQMETDMMEQMNEEMASAVGLQEEWNDLQQRDISQAAAGVRRRNFFISLMSRFSEIQGVINGQLDAEGYSMRENERTMGTLEKQVESLKAACEALAIAIGDAGLLNELKAVVEGTKDAVEWFNGLDDTMQTIIITFTETAAAVKLLDLALKAIGVQGGLLASGAALKKLYEAAKAIGGIAGAASLAKGSLQGMGSVLLRFAGGPVGVALMGIATAIGVIHKETSKANAELLESAKTAKKVLAEYDALIEAGESTVALENQMAEVFPNLITGWNEKTGAIELDIEALRDLAKIADTTKTNLEEEANLLNEKANAAEDASARAIEAQIKETETARDNALERMRILGEEIKSLQAFQEEKEKWEPWFTKGKYNPLGLIGDLSAELTGYGEGDLREKQEELAAQKRIYDESAKAIEEAIARVKEMGTESDNASGGVNKFGGSLKSTADYADAFKDAMDLIEKSLGDINNVIFDHNNALDILGSKYQLLENTFLDGVPGIEQEAQAIENLNAQIAEHEAVQDDLHATAEKYRAQLVGITDIIEQEDAKLTAGTITKEDHASAIKILQDEYDELDRKVKDMSAAWWDEEVAIQSLQDQMTEFDVLQSEALLSGWTDAIDTAIDKAQAKFDKAMDRIDKKMEKAKESFSGFKDAIDDAFEGVGDDVNSNFSEKLLKDMPSAMGIINSLSSEMFEGANIYEGVIEQLYPAPSESAMQDAFQNIQDTFSGIFDLDNYLPDDDFLNLSAEDFIAKLDTSLEGLSGASTDIATALANVESWEAAELRKLDNEIKRVQEQLEKDLTVLEGLFEGYEESTAKFEKGQAGNNLYQSIMAMQGIETAMPDMPTTEEIGSIFNSLVDMSKTVLPEDLGSLSPDEFASLIGADMDILGDLEQTAQGYLNAISNTAQTEIDNIDAEIEKIETKLESDLAALQAQLDALDEEETENERERALKEHNDKLAELEEERYYHSLRTGYEHVEAIADINQQIADENERWTNQQTDWGIDDERARINAEMDALKEQAKTDTEIQESLRVQAENDIDLMTTAIQNLINYIGLEIQERRDATEEYTGLLEEEADAEIESLENLKTIVSEKAELLTEMLEGLKQYVTDSVAEWENLANQRKDIEQSALDNILDKYEQQKEDLKEIWQDTQDDLLEITKNGTLAQLAMMMAMNPEFAKTGQAVIQSLIDSITDEGLRDTIQPQIDAILALVNSGTGTPGQPGQPGQSGQPGEPPSQGNQSGYWYEGGNLYVGGSRLGDDWTANTDTYGHIVAWREDRGMWKIYDASGYDELASGRNAEAPPDNWSNKQIEAYNDAEDARDWLEDNNYEQGAEDISGYKYVDALNWYNKWIEPREDLSDEVKAHFWEIVTAKYDFEHLALGGIVPGGNPVLKMLGDAPYDEAVVPLPAIQPMIDEAVLSALDNKGLNPDFSAIASYINQADMKVQAQIDTAVSNNFDKATDRIVNAIEKRFKPDIKNLLHIEHAEFEDKADMEIFGREIMRQVKQY